MVTAGHLIKHELKKTRVSTMLRQTPSIQEDSQKKNLQIEWVHYPHKSRFRYAEETFSNSKCSTHTLYPFQYTRSRYPAYLYTFNHGIARTFSVPCLQFFPLSSFFFFWQWKIVEQTILRSVHHQSFLDKEITTLSIVALQPAEAKRELTSNYLVQEQTLFANNRE